MEIKIKKLHKDAILPRYSTDGASAFDLFAHEDVKWEYESGAYSALVKTGWAFEIPEGKGMFILSRSGHGFKNLVHLANCVGLLDFDYRGEAMVKLVGLGNTVPEIKAGKAVAQVVILDTPRVFFNVKDELSETERGSDGFGSTDKKD